MVSLDRGPSGEEVNEAERLGARVGDVLLKVNQHSLVGVPFQEIITDRIKNAQYPITMHLQGSSSSIKKEAPIAQRETRPPQQGMQRQLQHLQMRHLMQQQQHHSHQQQLIITQQRQQQALQQQHAMHLNQQHPGTQDLQFRQKQHLKRPHEHALVGQGMFVPVPVLDRPRL